MNRRVDAAPPMGTTGLRLADGQSPDALRASALQSLRALLEGDVAALMELGAPEGDTIPMLSIETFGDESETRDIHTAAPPGLRRGTYLLEDSSRVHPVLRDIHELKQVVGERIIDRYHRAAAVTVGFHNQVRTMVYDGNRLVGWFGVFTRREASPHRLLRRRAQRALPSLLARITLWDRARRELLNLPPGDLLITPNANVQFASETGRRWLAIREFAERLPRAIRWFDGLDREVATCGVYGARMRLIRLTGEASVLYLAHVEPPAEIRTWSGEPLTRLQAAVADFAAAGATASEIAAHVGCAEGTVRVHLREAYRKLRVRNRAELARTLRGLG